MIASRSVHAPWPQVFGTGSPVVVTSNVFALAPGANQSQTTAIPAISIPPRFTPWEPPTPAKRCQAPAGSGGLFAELLVARFGLIVGDGLGDQRRAPSLRDRLLGD